MESILLPQIIATGIYHSDVAAKNKEISKKRKTTMFELELPLSSGGVSYIDGEKSAISPNLIICAKPGQMRHTKFPFHCYYIHLMVTEGALYDLLMALPEFITAKKPEIFKELFQKIHRHNRMGLVADRIRVQSLILELIYSLERKAPHHGKNQGLKEKRSDSVEQAIAFVNEHLCEDISLEKVAKHVSLSPVYFHKLFKSATGMTLHRFVEELRIKKAMDLLVSTRMTLTEIAYECGFSSQSYFSYVFKRCVKTTPRDYVKEIYRQYDR